MKGLKILKYLKTAENHSKLTWDWLNTLRQSHSELVDLF